MFVGSGYALLLDSTASETNRIQVTNTGDTLYYGPDSTVSSSSHEGQLLNGESVILERVVWVRSAGKSQLLISHRDSIATQTEFDGLNSRVVATEAATPPHGSVELATLTTSLSERLPQLAVLTEEQKLTKENTTPQEITQLTFEINSSATQSWGMWYFLLLEGINTEHDFKIEIVGSPTNAVSTSIGGWGAIYGANASSPGWQATGEGNNPGELQRLNNSAKFGSRAGLVGIPLYASIRGGGNAGKVLIKASQVTSNNSVPIVLPGSQRFGFKFAA